jgi:broad specificity phosphatase PhoE
LLVGRNKLIDPARVHRVYVSPRKRAQQTFTCLFSGREQHPSLSIDDEQVNVTEDIAEWDYGDYDGLRTDEIRQLRKDRGLDQERPWDIWQDGCEGGEYDFHLRQSQKTAKMWQDLHNKLQTD